MISLGNELLANFKTQVDIKNRLTGFMESVDPADQKALSGDQELKTLFESIDKLAEELE
jgi:hypothetical protein